MALVENYKAIDLVSFPDENTCIMDVWLYPCMRHDTLYARISLMLIETPNGHSRMPWSLLGSKVRAAVQLYVISLRNMNFKEYRKTR